MDIRDAEGRTRRLLWQDEAACRAVDPDIFYPEKGGSTREAKAICAVCPVQQPCLLYALYNQEQYGVWGGRSERERRRLAPPRGGPWTPERLGVEHPAAYGT